MTTTHPGYEASECPIRGIVTPRCGGAVGAGYNCLYTGGHCLPSTLCEGYREAYIRDQERSERLNQIYNPQNF